METEFVADKPTSEVSDKERADKYPSLLEAIKGKQALIEHLVKENEELGLRLATNCPGAVSLFMAGDPHWLVRDGEVVHKEPAYHAYLVSLQIDYRIYAPTLEHFSRGVDMLYDNPFLDACLRSIVKALNAAHDALRIKRGRPIESEEAE